VGVAPNKTLAKVCSDINKPNGQYVLPPSREAVLAFINTLPTRKVRGGGRDTVRGKLLGARAGINTGCGVWTDDPVAWIACGSAGAVSAAVL
jgi:nucleotidyltransferase/DNA polymerase involved in DNA repair